MSNFKRFNASENNSYDSSAVYPNGTLTWDGSNGLRLHDGSTSGGINIVSSSTDEPRFEVYSNTMNIGTSLNKRYGIDTSNVATTIYLPSNPNMGDTFFVADAGGAFATNNLTISRNGMTINDQASDIVLNTNGDSIGMFWNGSTWRLYE